MLPLSFPHKHEMMNVAVPLHLSIIIRVYTRNLALILDSHTTGSFFDLFICKHELAY